MVKRAIIFVLVILAVLLIGTAQSIYARPMDGLSVAWFIAAALVSGTASAATARTLAWPFLRGKMRASLDGFSWAAFLALPLCVGLLGNAIWTLCWYFLGWD